MQQFKFSSDSATEFLKLVHANVPLLDSALLTADSGSLLNVNTVARAVKFPQLSSHASVLLFFHPSVCACARVRVRIFTHGGIFTKLGGLFGRVFPND